MVGEIMQFPETVEEFMQQYKIVDTQQFYTNGTELVPIFRMKQWFDAHKQRWIPCSERLPKLIKNDLGVEYSETVFVLTSGRKIMAAFLRRVPGDKAIWIAPLNFWEAWDEKITHWMEFPPLPEPPEEGGDRNGLD